MKKRLGNLKKLSPLQLFQIASLVVLLVGMGGVGWWVGNQIENGVVNRTAATTALYVDSFVAPELQGLTDSDTLTADHTKKLNWLLQGTSFGKQIPAFKVFNKQGKVLFNTDYGNPNQSSPAQDYMNEAWQGTVAARLDNATGLDGSNSSRLLEVYSPIRVRGTDRVIAVVEFYQTADALGKEIGSAQFQSWLIVGGATIIMYLLLFGFVQRASQTITGQQAELKVRVEQLTALLTQNEELNERVRRAVARSADYNERFLRRISAELHDGPIQDLSLVLLRLDQLNMYVEQSRPLSHSFSGGSSNKENFTATDYFDPGVFGLIQNSTQNALKELRAISNGLGLPQLDKMTLAASVERAVRVHERRSNTKVDLYLDNLPAQASLSLKITLYRVIQEALNNGYRHSGGTVQTVKVVCKKRELHLEICDDGIGFNYEEVRSGEEHLGLSGMRERVESLGGSFNVSSSAGGGTKVSANLTLTADAAIYV